MCSGSYKVQSLETGPADLCLVIRSEVAAWILYEVAGGRDVLEE